MPAVQLARLKSQINELTWKFTRPVEFQHDLDELFEFYSNRVLKPGKAVPANRRVEAYHIPPIILNQLELELEPYVLENPSAALLLADALWKDERLEPRLLAASLLGLVPIKHVNEILQRINQWSKTGSDNKSIEALFCSGARRLRHEKPEQWFNMIQTWLYDNAVSRNSHAVQALIPAAREHDFENIPLIFQAINSLMDNQSATLQPALIELLQVLAKRTPAETLYFLKHHIILSNHPGTLRLVRHLIPAFELEHQNMLKSFIAEKLKSGSQP